MRFPFPDYVGLLNQFLDIRPEIVDSLERRLFSTQGKASALNGDRDSIAEAFSSCFFELSSLPPHLSRLNGQLDAAYRADGFEPAVQDGYSRQLSPVELVLRACHHWERTRWPGRNGRIGYTQSLYAAFMLPQLEHLSLRIWDEDTGHAIVRLQQVQELLDRLNAGSSPSARPVQLARDVRWLVQTAQGPLTRYPKAYFIKADQVSTLPGETRLEIHKAGAVLAGGHLRSQLRHLSQRTGWPFEDRQLVALTRSSNSMDTALLVRDLVPLLDAYLAACARQEANARLALADAILQGLSADPELLLTRLDLLEPSTMLEDLFVSSTVDAPPYTAMGEAHRACVARYRELIGRAAADLLRDSREFNPAQAVYSPLGIIYGFCADLFANMVLNSMHSASPTDLSLEDSFVSRGRLDAKLAQARDWERLPKGDVERVPFEHSRSWAEQLNTRMIAALEARAANHGTPNASEVRRAWLYVAPRGVAIDTVLDNVLPAEPVAAQEHCLTSDVARARLTGATVLPPDRLVADRAEGRLLACANADGAWFGVSKVLLTLCISQGKDALVTDVPRTVVDIMRRVCPELLVVVSDGRE